MADLALRVGVATVLAVAAVAAVAGCARAPVAPPVAAAQGTRIDPCAPAQVADFEGPGEYRLQRYAQALAPRAAVAPHEVEVAIVPHEPEAGWNGVTAAEISCGSNAGDGPYRITLYRNALAGRPLQTAYHTVAHELHHVAQIRRDRLPCQPDESMRERYEREADAFADRVAPACGQTASLSR
jgi:hypothetical protein